MAAPAVYFEIGKATLSVDEQAHLEFIAKNILAKVEENGKVYLTVMGSADSNTGTAARNKHLSEARGKYVADMLTAKYGIAKDRLVVKSEVVKAKADPQLDRAVMISF
jgi:outer membrane protein OmpA-like peptidoglycan-associated protein